MVALTSAFILFRSVRRCAYMSVVELFWLIFPVRVNSRNVSLSKNVWLITLTKFIKSTVEIARKFRNLVRNQFFFLFNRSSLKSSKLHIGEIKVIYFILIKQTGTSPNCTSCYAAINWEYNEFMNTKNIYNILQR